MIVFINFIETSCHNLMPDQKLSLDIQRLLYIQWIALKAIHCKILSHGLMVGKQHTQKCERFSKLLSCVHAKSKFNLCCDEITYKVNGMMRNHMGRCDRPVARQDHHELMRKGGDFHVHRIFAQVQNIQLQWFYHTITRCKYFFRFWCVRSLRYRHAVMHR